VSTLRPPSANILISNNGDVKIADLGLARSMAKGERGARGRGDGVGGGTESTAALVVSFFNRVAHPLLFVPVHVLLLPPFQAATRTAW
jgi:serine/threonine protein kinase